MKKLNVKQVIISKQKENSENFEKFLGIVKEKNIEVKVVKTGDRVNVEKNLYIDVLWPQEQQISDNPLNNNAIVFKLVYKNFSMLFTGDIEKVAEQDILNKYEQNLHMLNSTVLKVAHHGSKTSSTKHFLEAVKPKIALIGVGEKNIFGHPSDVTLEILKSLNSKIYRTDKDGEITIKTNGKKINIYKKIS